MGGGAWPFLVGGAICLVNSVNERDLNLLNSRAYLCGGFTALTWAINPCQPSRAKPGAGVEVRCGACLVYVSPAGPTLVSGGPGLGVLRFLEGLLDV